MLLLDEIYIERVLVSLQGAFDLTVLDGWSHAESGYYIKEGSVAKGMGSLF